MTKGNWQIVALVAILAALYFALRKQPCGSAQSTITFPGIVAPKDPTSDSSILF